MGSQMPSLGVEEEFHLVDPRTRLLAPEAEALLGRLGDGRFVGEMQRSTVETNSSPWQGLDELGHELRELRRELCAAAAEADLAPVAVGTVPLANAGSLALTPDERFARMHEDYQQVVREQLICGMQVHVSVPDRDLAVAVVPRVAPWLPVLLAISASSPYWLGADSGYASWRTLVWQRWPTAGPSGPFESAAHYDRLVDDLVASGVISDRGMIYFDVRPSAHVPTLELRVCDACPQVEDVLLVAGLFRGLVTAAGWEAEAGGPRPEPVRGELLRAATWRAARSGMEGELFHPRDGTRAKAPDMLRKLIAEIRPALEANGDWERVNALAAEALGRGSAAARQRMAYTRRGALSDVVDLMIEETASCG
ncbi:carboxylate-amine ligase [Bailinhaonella thermotolerans]|uniref:Putative glutamate--cysteine ligase 2 n=1 Tax=Bailinhaonella thermotolerans TaxID=1070861 RepID=A0A3A4B8C3_9ACTN|nr:glutamate--cysteine ligase [Bailinhaonella thermotolerans]RJL34481.1 YbdK family carboxylate-amine ligase [Bailinhaonella thermotolerans]